MRIKVDKITFLINEEQDFEKGGIVVMMVTRATSVDQ